MNEMQMAPGSADKVFDLVDAIEETDLMDRTGPVLGRTVYELVDVVQDTISAAAHHAISEDEVRKQITAIAESVARELFPAIAERIIREEIAKLKGETHAEPTK